MEPPLVVQIPSLKPEEWVAAAVDHNNEQWRSRWSYELQRLKRRQKKLYFLFLTLLYIIIIFFVLFWLDLCLYSSTTVATYSLQQRQTQQLAPAPLYTQPRHPHRHRPFPTAAYSPEMWI